MNWGSTPHSYLMCLTKCPFCLYDELQLGHMYLPFTSVAKCIYLKADEINPLFYFVNIHIEKLKKHVKHKNCLSSDPHTNEFKRQFLQHITNFHDQTRQIYKVRKKGNYTTSLLCSVRRKKLNRKKTPSKFLEIFPHTLQNLILLVIFDFYKTKWIICSNIS